MKFRKFVFPFPPKLLKIRQPGVSDLMVALTMTSDPRLPYLPEANICVRGAAGETAHTNIHDAGADTSASVYIAEEMENKCEQLRCKDGTEESVKLFLKRLRTSALSFLSSSLEYQRKNGEIVSTSR